MKNKGKGFAMRKGILQATGDYIIFMGGDGQDDNPFDWDSVCANIEKGLLKDDFVRGQEYEIMLVPNIVNITYGRGVGYVFEEESFSDSITSISATKIREKMRQDGDL